MFVVTQWSQFSLSFNYKNLSIMNSLPGYFTKIDSIIKSDEDILNNIKLGQLTSSYVGEYVVLEYRHIENVDYVLSLHTRKFCKIDPTHILYASLSGTPSPGNHGLLGAHIDHGPKVVLNYYLEADTDVTSFFKNNKNISGEVYPGREEANVFNTEDLEMIGNFIANSRETFLLNVSEIHCVHKLTDIKRSFISYSWHHNTYQEILDNLC